MSKPLVSVIMPSYRYAKYLRRCIDSVLNQTYDNFEIIFSDDGSYDGTREIMEEYDDPRIKAVFLEHNVGFINNVRKCAERVTGEYCAYIGTDDYWLPDKLEKQVAFMEGNPDYGSVFTYVTTVDKDGQELKDEKIFTLRFNRPALTSEKLLTEYFFVGTTMSVLTLFTKTQMFKDAISTVDGIDFAGDYYIMKELVLRAKTHIIEEPLACYRWHGENASSTSTAHVRYNNSEMFILFGAFFDDLSKEDFKSAFRDFLLFDGELSDEEMECEIINLYLFHPSKRLCRLLALQRFYKNHKNKKFLETFFGKYGFSHDDITALKRSYYITATDENEDEVRLYPKFVFYKIET